MDTLLIKQVTQFRKITTANASQIRKIAPLAACDQAKPLARARTCSGTCSAPGRSARASPAESSCQSAPRRLEAGGDPRAGLRRSRSCTGPQSCCSENLLALASPANAAEVN